MIKKKVATLPPLIEKQRVPYEPDEKERNPDGTDSQEENSELKNPISHFQRESIPYSFLSSENIILPNQLIDLSTKPSGDTAVSGTEKSEEPAEFAREKSDSLYPEERVQDIVNRDQSGFCTLENMNDANDTDDADRMLLEAPKEEANPEGG